MFGPLRTPHPPPPGISNPFCGGSMDIFWNYTMQFLPQVINKLSCSSQSDSQDVTNQYFWYSIKIDYNLSFNIENRSVDFLWLSILSISVIKQSILSILIGKYCKHKKHNHSMSQQRYRSLVQLQMEKKWVTLAKFVIIDFYWLL